MAAYPTFEPVDDPSTGGTASPGLRIDGDLTINDVARWHAALKERMAAVAELCVDLTAVTAVDAIGIQLLCSAKRTAESEGKTFCVQGAGPEIRRACEKAGVAPVEAGLS